MGLEFFKNINFKKEFFAGFLVFLVALPLSLGISMATGTDAAAGIVSAIIGGIVVGYLSGCPLQVSGPAAGLITVIMDCIRDNGIHSLATVVFLAGLIQIIFAYFKIGQIFRAVAPAIIQGMLSGIGIVILASQFHIMVDDLPREDTIQNLISIPESIWKGLVPLDGSYHHIAALIGSQTIVIILILNYLPRKFKLIPPSLIAVASAILIANSCNFPINYIKVPENVLADLDFLFRDFQISRFFDSSILLTSLIMAFVASAETMLTATAVDQMHDGKRTRYNKEIFAQGLGNLLCGLIGALPVSGVIVRSATNVQAGAKTRLSTMIHGVFLLIFLLVFPSFIRLIPSSALAAVLVYTGYKLINFKAIINLLNFGKAELFIYFLTVICIVNFGLLEGILGGLIAAVIKLLHQTTYLEVKTEKLNDYEYGEHIKVDIRGAANFMSLPSLAEEFEHIEENKKIVIYFDKLNYIDHACLDYIINWEQQYESLGGRVYLKLNTLPERLSEYERSVRSHKRQIREEKMYEES